MRALDLGCGQAQMARQLWPECEIVTVDANPEAGADVVADVRMLPESLGRFDYIIAAHVLEHLARLDALPAVQHWASFLLPGGQLHILAPDLEWAAELLVLSDEPPSNELLMHLYGAQGTPWDFHRWGYTAHLLRGLLKKAGLQIERLESWPYLIVIPGGEPTQARQLYAICTAADGDPLSCPQIAQIPQTEAGSPPTAQEPAGGRRSGGGGPQ